METDDFFVFWCIDKKGVFKSCFFQGIGKKALPDE